MGRHKSPKNKFVSKETGRFHYIYLITNTVNGKQYVGKCNTDKISASYWGSGVLLKKAYKKYGRDKFTKQIIYWAENKDTLNKAECYFIWRYQTLESLKLGGYNRYPGGNGGVQHSPEVRQRISATLKNTYRPHLYKPRGKYTEEHRRNIRIAVIEQHKRLGHNIRTTR